MAGPQAEARSGTTEGAKEIDPASMDSAKGEVTYCQGKDTSGNAHYMIDEFNKKFGGDGLKAKLVEFPASADEQRNQFIQRQQAKSGDCDVFSSDVIWTAEFASQKWLYDMTPYMEDKKADFIEAPIETITYDGKIWGSPESSDAGVPLLQHRQGQEVPATWQEVYAEAQGRRHRLPGRALRGPDLRLPRAVLRRRRQVLSEDGTKSTIDRRRRVVKALQFMVDGIKDGAAPKAVTTYMEPESLAAFQTGKYAYMRNWPYAYALNQKAARSRATSTSLRSPVFEGGEKAGILGGHNSVISVYSKNPGAALKLVDFIGSPEIQKAYAAQFSLSPVRAEVYDDPEVKKAIPFADELRRPSRRQRPSGVAGVPADLAGDLQERQRGARRVRCRPEDASQEGPVGHREGVVDVLGHG